MQLNKNVKYSTLPSRHFFHSMLIVCLLLLATGCATVPESNLGGADGGGAVNQLNDMYVYNKGEEVYIVFDSDQPVEYNSFMASYPLRLVMDISNVGSRAIKKKVGVHKGGVLKISKKINKGVVNSVRFEVHLMYPRPYKISRNNNELIIKFLQPVENDGGIEFGLSDDLKSKIVSGRETAEKLKNGNGNNGLITSATSDLAGSGSGGAEGFTPLNMIDSELGSADLETRKGLQPGSSSPGTLKSIKRSSLGKFNNQWGNSPGSSDQQNKSVRARNGLKALSGSGKFTPVNKATPFRPRISGVNEKDLVATGSAGKLSQKSRNRLILKDSQPVSGLESLSGGGLSNNPSTGRSLSSLSPATHPAAGQSLRQSLLNNGAGQSAVGSSRDVKGDASAPLPGNYKIGSADVLEVLVWRNENLSRVVVVRPDGMITLPLLGDFMASGKTPMGLREEIVLKLKDYEEVPEVSVIVREINSYIIYVLGEVLRPGPYNLSRDTVLLQAITLAGGFTQFAAKNNIIILRSHNGKETRFKIKYKDILSGEEGDKNMKLESGDTIIIP